MYYVERSKTGMPTITENGGGATNTGNAQVVCGANGNALKPLFVPRGYSCGIHAIFVVRMGMCIVEASRDRRGESVRVSRVARINDDDTLTLSLLFEYENGDSNIPPSFQEAANAALEKSRCYHCRKPHYIKGL